MYSITFLTLSYLVLFKISKIWCFSFTSNLINFFMIFSRSFFTVLTFGRLAYMDLSIWNSNIIIQHLLECLHSSYNFFASIVLSSVGFSSGSISKVILSVQKVKCIFKVFFHLTLFTKKKKVFFHFRKFFPFNFIMVFIGRVLEVLSTI